ncbi:hypothetical protein GA0115240_10014 [Streptomyces sp. DvalAA-14]|uniref:hypothetical protein n=1 Tax=unclassified Streptomyces TaxID=2593676 RepID=UPI00081BAB4D|nr:MULTISPECIES: hypothetical protein [unclassified Streptomyces]MYS18683.1 hypothetical protein [Streptomyces sp. SID4948]SCD27524.1 hypothetical protein GA0115240_10014 [Streptomyces sp. DvalAA-14]
MHHPTDEPTSEALDELAEGLAELAASTAPGRGIDIARAMRDGRLRLRRKRLAAAGTVAVAAAATVAVSLLPSVGDRAQSPAPAAAPASVERATDPLVVEASYGWLPAGFTGVDYLPDHGGTVLRATGRIPDGGSLAPIVWLKVYPAGTTPSTGRPWYPGGPRQYRVQAAPVGGRPAYWVGKGPTTAWAPGGDWYLRWQTADGRWAEMQSTYLTGTDAQQTLHRIAEGVVVARRAVPLAYRISGVPAPVKLASADLLQAQPIPGDEHLPWTSSVSFTVDGMSITTTIRPGPPPATKGAAAPNSPRPQDRQTCLQAHGLSVCTNSPYGVNAYRAVGGPEAWLKKFTLLGTDRRAWTADVLG